MTAALVAASLMVLSASGANTRALFIGASPLVGTDGQPTANVGVLKPTPVSIPAAPPAPANATMFEVQIASLDNQNLAHTILTVSAGTATGLSLNTFYDPTGGTADSFCASVGNLITCDYGSLEAYGTRTIAVVVDVDSSYTVDSQVTPLFWATVTTNNENGSNQQTFSADSGSFTVGAFSADALNTFVPPGQAKQLSTSPVGTGGNLSTTIAFTAPTAQTVAMSEGSSNSKYLCPAGYACQPEYSEVITSTGSFFVSPYFHWTLTALVPKTYTLSQGFVAHYDDGATDPDWVLPFKSKSSFCGSLEITANGHCIKTLSLSKPVNGWSTLTIEVVMDHQGGLRI